MLDELRQECKKAIWDVRAEDLPFLKRASVITARIFHSILRDLAQGQLSMRAMSLVYTTVISLVPLLALCFSVLKGFGAHNQIEPMLLNLLEPLGEKRVDITQNIIGFVDNIQVGVLGAMGLALLIYSVVAMMQKIERSFNYAWRITRERSFSQRFSDYLSVLMIGPLMIFLSVGITASVRTDTAVEYLGTVPGMVWVIEMVGLILPYFIMAIGFAFIYFFMPNTKVKLGSAFIGGLVTAVAWKAMGWLFATFVAASSTQTAIYSAFASVIVLMVWLYVGWLVLLIGASVAYYHQYPNNMLLANSGFVLSIRMRERLGLLVMFLIGQRFAQEKDPWTAEKLANKVNMPSQIVSYMLDVLERGVMFINPQDKVYEGMIIGENSRENDLVVNVLKGKQLTNIRASGSDEAVRLTPPRKLTLEALISYIDEDELVEVTPENLRLRKKLLLEHERKKASRAKAG